GWLPPGSTKRAAVLGAVCMAVIGPLALAALWQASVSEMPLHGFITFKALFAAGLALLVTPVISLWALTAPA
ncbi:MAG: hypothetical protein ABI629_03150, partial [bacterium]